MGVNMVVGFALLFAAGIFQGSFGLGYKNYKPFSWAAFWGIYCLLCMVTVIGVAWIQVPSLPEFIKYYKILPVFCGMLWGISAVGFSKAIDKIGMSMVYGISMGISTIVGSVMPMILNSALPVGSDAVKLYIGLILTVIGVIIITVAGVRRDGGAKGSALGYLLSILSGLGSGAMNIGFNGSEVLGYELMALDYSQLAISAVKWLPVLVGGCIMGMIWCICELFIRKEWYTVKLKGSAVRSAKLFIVSMIWYAALLLYGLSIIILGEKYSSVGWILFNALALIISTAWGLKNGEWRNHSKKLLFIGCAVLIAAWMFI